MGSFLADSCTRLAECTGSARFYERKHYSLCPSVVKIFIINLVMILSCSTHSVWSTECMKRKYYEITVTYMGGQLTSSGNRTVNCNAYFQWTIQDFCCYDRFDRYEKSPYCCYSETYKLVLAVGFICLVLLSCSFSIFFCWVYNLPHHILYVLTCGRFHLNAWMLRNKNGPYVDPSFYSAGDPFWARGPETQTYAMGPLRPMPPKIFYPAPPPKLKYRWDMTNGEIPLFIIASRQFTRNPYSARPSDRTVQPTHHATSFLSTISESRRNSLTNSSNHLVGVGNGGITNEQGTPYPHRRETNSAPNGAPRRGSSALLPYRTSGNLGFGYNGGNNGTLSMPPPPPFRVNIDEMEAAAELIEALKLLDERGDNKSSDWNPKSSPSLVNSVQLSNLEGGSGNIFTVSEGNAKVEEANTIDRITVRPNTTGGGGCLDQYGNYVSLTNHSPIGLMGGGGYSRHIKPNQDALNQQLSSLGLPVYSMPGVHTAGVLSTVQNYHVVSSNLGNPMETILEDDSVDEDQLEKNCSAEKSKTRSSYSPSSSVVASPMHAIDKVSKPVHSISRTRRAASISVTNTTFSKRISSTMDHVVVPTPTARAVVPFTPTLPGSLPEGSSSTVDATFIDSLVKQGEPAVRRNSII